jgi:hypothetical protein
MRHCVLLTIAAATLTGVPLAAHDFWLAASSWVPDSRVTISGNLGEHFPLGTDYIGVEGVDRWRVIGPAGDVDIQPAFRREGNSLAVDLELPAPGAYLATMTIRPKVTEMNGPLFTSYLLEEGLEWVVDARQRGGVSQSAAKERFARYAKIALRNGAGDAAHLRRPLGFPAEFVPMTDPTILRPGQFLTLQLLAHGTPVTRAEVTAHASGGGHPIVGRTDSFGHVTLPIDRPGAWLVRTVHMTSGPVTGSPDVEWDSHWATLAFHTAEAR